MEKNERNLKKLNAIQMYAASKGGICLARAYVSAKEKVEWECKHGHRWFQNSTTVTKAGTWCPVCAGNTKRSIEELKNIVESRGGKLITSDYRGVDGLYTIQCSLGHIFENRFKKIENGQWCPICAKSGKSEEICRTVFEQLFAAKFPKKRPLWLRNSLGRQMELVSSCIFKRN